MTASGAGTSARNEVSRWPVLQAPKHWRRLDFISDLHLQLGDAITFNAWQNYMQTTRADAVFILGDLFDVWVGDDVLGGSFEPDPASAFAACCVQTLNAAAQRLRVFLMHGNRDFLLGAAFAQACNLTLLDDPAVLDFADSRWLLSHGDALCLSDTDYMRFRKQVRSAAWQQDFLRLPLPQRQDKARALRAQSEARKRRVVVCVDLDASATQNWLMAAQAQTLIHGHTHRPAEHALAHGMRRLVLSDWDLGATPARAQVLRLNAPLASQVSGNLSQRLTLAQATQ